MNYEFVEFDHGFDYYAPQLFIDENDRVIIIGWMGYRMSRILIQLLIRIGDMLLLFLVKYLL